MRVLKWTALALLGLSAVASAGNRPEVTQVSFSPDHTRALALVKWQEDGSGFSNAHLNVLEVSTGRTLRRVRAQSQGILTPDALLGRIQQNHADYLRASGLGSPLVSKPRYQRVLSGAPRWTEAIGAGLSQTQQVFLWSRNVPVTLQVTRGKQGCSEAGRGLLPAGDTPATFSLDVNGQTLRPQTDAALPCATRYALDRVDLSGNRVLITVRAYLPGFEGPDALPVFVSGILR